MWQDLAKDLPEGPAEDLPRQGVYVLVARVRREHVLKHRILGNLRLRPGYYAYVGRARRGLAARLARHARSRRRGKRLFWHVDYFLELADLEEIWVLPLAAGECALAASLEESGGERGGLAGFGSSDCRCPGHLLFFGGRKPRPHGAPLALSLMREP